MKKFMFLLAASLCFTSCAPVGVLSESNGNIILDSVSTVHTKTCTFATESISNPRDIETMLYY